MHHCLHVHVLQVNAPTYRKRAQRLPAWPQWHDVTYCVTAYLVVLGIVDRMCCKLLHLPTRGLPNSSRIAAAWRSTSIVFTGSVVCLGNLRVTTHLRLCWRFISARHARLWPSILLPVPVPPTTSSYSLCKPLLSARYSFPIRNKTQVKSVCTWPSMSNIKSIPQSFLCARCVIAYCVVHYQYTARISTLKQCSSVRIYLVVKTLCSWV